MTLPGNGPVAHPAPAELAASPADPVPRPDDALVSAVALRPSDYTAALVHRMQLSPSWVRGARVLDVGCGSGLLLAAAGDFGAASLTGVDVEPDAVAASRALLLGAGHGRRSDIIQGDMFVPLSGRQFDLIVANLPHFPMVEVGAEEGRHLTWSAGGHDGRVLLDRFLAGLAGHLSTGGRALIVHNAFVGLETTRAAVRGTGLNLRITDTILVPVSPAKSELMPPELLARETGKTVFRYGPHVLAEVFVVAISREASDDSAQA
ncbi:MAG: methyltransferase [Pseudomonadota bacterium]